MKKEKGWGERGGLVGGLVAGGGEGRGVGFCFFYYFD